MTLVTKYFLLQITFETQRLWALSVWEAQIVWGSKGHIVCVCVRFLLNNAYSLHLSQRVDERRGGPFISGFTELLNASWEEGEILRGRVLRKASVITFSFQPAFVPHIFDCGAGCDHECYRIKSATVTWKWIELLANCEFWVMKSVGGACLAAQWG